MFSCAPPVREQNGRLACSAWLLALLLRNGYRCECNYHHLVVTMADEVRHGRLLRRRNCSLTMVSSRVLAVLCYHWLQRQGPLGPAGCRSNANPANHVRRPAHYERHDSETPGLRACPHSRPRAARVSLAAQSVIFDYWLALLQFETPVWMAQGHFHYYEFLGSP